MAWIE